MNTYDHVPTKTVFSVIILSYIFLLYITGYALNEKSSLSWGQITLFLMISSLIFFLFVYLFYKKSLAKPIDTIKSEHAVIDDYVNIRHGQFGNSKTTLGKWYVAAIIVAFIFPLFTSIIISTFAEPDLILIFVGFGIIVTFIIGMIITNRQKRV